MLVHSLSRPSTPEFIRRSRIKNHHHHSEEAASGDKNGPASAKELRRVCDMYRTFLDSSIALGRSLWTQYDTSLMWWGLAVLLAATAALAFRVVASPGWWWCSAGAAAASGFGGGSSGRPPSPGQRAYMLLVLCANVVASLVEPVFLCDFSSRVLMGCGVAGFYLLRKVKEYVIF